MSTGEEKIQALCESWLAATALPEGGFGIGGASERFRLLNNGIVFHELDHEGLRAACLGLSTVLLMPGLNTVIDWDHQWFWAWCGELLCGSGSDYFSHEDYELRNLMGLCIRATLAGTYRPDEQGWEQQRDQTMSMEPNSREWIQRSQIALGYLAFPLLEGIVKRHCSEYVSMSGEVQQPFEVPGSGSGQSRKYLVGRICSSLRDLLWLLHAEVASQELRSDLDEQRAHLAAFSDLDQGGFQVLYQWRNDSLHGGASLTTIGGTVLNTAFLIALSQIQDNYETVRMAAVDRVRWELQSPTTYRSPWSYYPPYR